ARGEHSEQQWAGGPAYEGDDDLDLQETLEQAVYEVLREPAPEPHRAHEQPNGEAELEHRVALYITRDGGDDQLIGDATHRDEQDRGEQQPHPSPWDVGDGTRLVGRRLHLGRVVFHVGVVGDYSPPPIPPEPARRPRLADRALE